jgi:hypothetical protein
MLEYPEQQARASVLALHYRWTGNSMHERQASNQATFTVFLPHSATQAGNSIMAQKFLNQTASINY